MTGGDRAANLHIPSDVLAAVLANLPSEAFTGDSRRIHSTFARAKASYPVLSVFNFTSGDVYPFSRDLEDALAVLQRSRIIRMENPDYDTYTITAGGRSLAGDVLAGFSGGEVAQIMEIALIFSAECGRVKWADLSNQADLSAA